MNEAAKRSVERWEREYQQLVPSMPNEPIARVKAHLTYLNEYFIRWLGFCALERANPEELANNDLLFVIEGASKVADADVGRLKYPGAESTKQAWQEYKSSLAELRDNLQKIKTEA